MGTENNNLEVRIMKEPILFLNEYRDDLNKWITKPTVSAPSDVMIKIYSMVELTIELVQTGRKVKTSEKQLFEGGTFLARYFDGWGDMYYSKYNQVVEFVEKNYF